MKKTLLSLLVLTYFSINAQVGINTTTPTATLHVYGTTVPGSAGGTVDLLNQDFNSAYSVVQSNAMTGCTGYGTNGWERTTTGDTVWGTNCTPCTGGWLWINSSSNSTCVQNATARIDLTTAPTSTSINISFDYSYLDYLADSFRAYLYNNTTSAQVGGNLVNLTADADDSYSGTATVVAGNSYSLRFEYQGAHDYGATVDNVLVTETGPGTYSFRLEDGTQADGKVLTSDADGNGYWQTPTGGGSGTDSQTLSISGNDLTISNGNTVTLPSGGSGSYTFSNGITETSGAVKLGGTLTQNTTINLNTGDLTFRSSTTAPSPGEMIIQGTDRVMMDTSFDKNIINFGGAAVLPAGIDGTSFTDSGGRPYTIDVALGVYTGSPGGSGFKMGSIEYITDGLGELFTNYSFNPLTNGSGNLGTASHRWSTIYATNGTIQTSDLRLKKNIKNLNYGLNEIMKLETITYNWKENRKGKTQIPENQQERKIGFSAQQLKTILPEVVQSHSWVPADEDGNYKRIVNEHLGVYYSDVIPVTVKAIQEQQTQIEELKEEIKLLKEAIELLKNK